MNFDQTISVNVGTSAKTANQVVSFVDILSDIFTATKNGVVSSYNYLKEVLWYRPREIPNKNTLRELEENKKEIEKGNIISFSRPEDAISYLNSIITARSG